MVRNITSISEIAEKIVVFICIAIIMSMPYGIVNKCDKKMVNAESIGYGGSSSIVIEQESGRVLYGNNTHEKLPNASTTKIVTALLVLDNMDPDQIITISKEAQGVEGSSIYLNAGDKWRVRDLLYGLMLRSGNDAATALAISCAGSIEKFSDLMNKKVAELGLQNSHFTNPHGLHDENHYTSSYDLAMLTKNAKTHQLFNTIVATKVYNFTMVNGDKSTFINKNKMLHNLEGANGVKTGYTKVAGRCLVSSATRTGMTLICVVLNCPDMWNVSACSLKNGFCEYRAYELLSSGEIAGTVKVHNGKKNNIMVNTAQSYRYPLTNEEYTQITYIHEFRKIEAPIKQGENVGEIKVMLDNHLLFSTNLYTIDNVDEKKIKFFDKLWR